MLTAVGADELLVVLDAFDVEEAVPLLDPVAVEETTEVKVAPELAAAADGITSSHGLSTYTATGLAVDASRRHSLKGAMLRRPSPPASASAWSRGVKEYGR